MKGRETSHSQREEARVSLWRGDNQSAPSVPVSVLPAVKYTKTFSAVWALEELMLELEKGNTDPFYSVKQELDLCKKYVYCRLLHPPMC